MLPVWATHVLLDLSAMLRMAQNHPVIAMELVVTLRAFLLTLASNLPSHLDCEISKRALAKGVILKHGVAVIWLYFVLLLPFLSPGSEWGY